MWVPVLDLEWVGWFGRFRFGRRDSLAVGEETAAYGWAVLGGFAVAVEEVEFVWCLRRRHFWRTKTRCL
jgi:hypothetical protein